MVNRINELFQSAEGERIYSRILKTVECHKMRPFIEQGLLIGLSGGADSVFLSAFVYEYIRRSKSNIKVLAVHINHMIRGSEADRDEAFSRKVAMELGFEFESRNIDVPALSKQCGSGLEEVAREARYSAFRDIIRGRNDVRTIATAHNLSDNAETILFNIVRGTGSSGAVGIAPIRGNIIRPLIDVSKDEIRAFLKKHDIDFMVDSTNDSVEYSRNYIRHEVMPCLAKINPRFECAFGNFAKALRCDLQYIEQCSRDDLAAARASSVKASLLRALNPAVFVRFLTEFAAYNGLKGLERCHYDAVAEMIDKDNFKVSVPGADFVCERGVCYFTRDSARPENPELCVPLVCGENWIEGYSGVIHLGSVPDVSYPNVYKISIQADLSSAIIVGSLYVRFRRDGDAYYYGGMTHKLKKVFNDRGIPPSHRNRIPVICDDKGIVWVPGMGVRDDGASGKNGKFISFLVPRNGCGEELFSALKGT